jgi:decaprenylphospho-beta-D-ribofuranose 2-oxidase
MRNLKIISGWGLIPRSLAFVTADISVLKQYITESTGRGVIPRGLGRSYGDSSSNSGGLVFETSRFKEIVIDPDSNTAICGAGVTIKELELEAAKFNLIPTVVPGTGYVTLGGAFASDIHGKSHCRDGSFSQHVKEIELVDGLGSKNHYLRGSVEFNAAAGGMGLTGVITELKIELEKVPTTWIVQEEKRANNLQELLHTINLFEEKYRYSVAWIDLSGKNVGRGIVSGGRIAEEDELKQKHRQSSGISDSNSKTLPFIGRANLLNKYTILFFNRLWFLKPTRHGIVSFSKFMHPLDTFSNWNLIYGRKGFIQYQFVVPLHRERALFEVLRIMRSFEISSFLTVLKKFGSESTGILSFPMPGWTLAIDIPANHPKLAEFCETLDQFLIEVGGRVYLTKDSVLTPSNFRAMYPRFEEWKTVKSQVDKSNLWISDQSRRLEL